MTTVFTRKGKDQAFCIFNRVAKAQFMVRIFNVHLAIYDFHEIVVELLGENE